MDLNQRIIAVHEALASGRFFALEELADSTRVPSAELLPTLRHLRDRLQAPLKYGKSSTGKGYHYDPAASAFTLPIVSIRLGPFVINRELQRTAAAVVWVATHAVQHHVVVIKVVKEPAGRDAKNLRFHAAAMAGMDHPHIAWVFDRGRVTAAEAAASGGDLEEGQAWLAAEYADQGSVVPAMVNSWHKLRDLLVSLLEALAYAHAHGGMHRGIAPGDVMAVADSGTRSGVKLYGLLPAAMVVQGELPSAQSVDRAHFLAPEALLLRWRDMGPASDLYSLGCWAWWMVTGKAPFDGVDDVRGLARAHATAGLPVFKPAYRMPSGFHAWLLRLLEKDPASRFSSAAHARASLLEVDRLRSAGNWRPVLATMPDHWRRSWASSRDMVLVGTGLGLFSMRPVPVVGRVEERDILWAGLRASRERKSARGACLIGAAGGGKTRLTEWLGHRVVETGAARVFSVRHNSMAPPGEALARMVVEAAHCGGLGCDAGRARMESLLRRGGVTARYEWDALTAVMAIAEGWPTEDLVTFERPQDRYVVIARFLHRCAKREPLLLVFDDVHYGADTMGFLEFLLDAPDAQGHPIYVVMTARSDVLAERSRERERLAQLLARSEVTALEIPPLPPSTTRILVEEHYGLTGDLARLVQERSGGIPLYAQQLIEGWVEAGMLRATRGGFEQVKGVTVQVPESLSEIWLKRVERALLGLADPEQIGHATWALEGAAVLGRDVPFVLWEGLCDELGLEPPEELIEVLCMFRLVQEGPNQFTFAHGLLRESLLVQAEQEGRLAHYHRCAANMLLRCASGNSDARALRRARHLIAATDFVEAEALLGASVGVRSAATDQTGFDEALALWAEALGELGVSSADTRWGTLTLHRAGVAQARGDWAEALEGANKAQHDAALHGWTRITSEADFLAARIAYDQGDYERSLEGLWRARKAFEQAGDRRFFARCTAMLGSVHAAQGEFGGAIALYREALRSLEQLDQDEPVWRGEATHMLGTVYQQQGRLDHALRLFLETLKIWETIGSQRGLASVANGLADLARLKGNLMKAEEWYQRAVAVFDGVGAWEAWMVRLNMALVQFARGNFNGAFELTESSLDFFERSGQRSWQAVAHAFMLPCVAQQRRWEQFDHHFVSAKELLNEVGFADADIARTVEKSGEIAQFAGQTKRSDRAFALAITQWRAIGREDEVKRLLRKTGPPTFH